MTNASPTANHSDLGNSSSDKSWHLSMLCISIVCLGIFVQFLNQTLYLKKAPFFDSVSYYDRLFEVVSVRQQQGLTAAVENATQKSSTFCLPYLLAIPFSYFMAPTRAIGVWIEVIYLSIFVFSFSSYLRKNRNASSSQIVACMVPVFLMNGLYRSTAGLSDLRVDLPLAFLYGAAACWWLIARRHKNWTYVILAGLCVGMACLTRATAPIFFAMGFVPLVIFDFWKSHNRLRLISQFSVVAAITLATAGWFYAIHFKFIYYYYAVWNTDANATVSMARSLKHVSSALKSVGVFASLFFLISAILTRRFLRNASNRSESTTQKRVTRLESRKLLWLAAAPVIFLIAKRTDINPFVSLPSAICLIMCLVVIFFDQIAAFSSRYQTRFVVTSFGLLVLTAIVGLFDHSSKHLDSVTPHQQVIRLLETNADITGKRHIVYSVNLLSSINTASLEGTFQYSPNARFIDAETVKIDNIQYSVEHDLLNPSQANWDSLPGDTITEKIQLLESRIANKVDYIVAPTADSVSIIQSKYNYSYSSRYASQILKQFHDSGHWQPISKAIDVEPGLQVKVLRNVSLAKTAQNDTPVIR